MSKIKSYTESDYYKSYINHSGGIGPYDVSEEVFRNILKDYFKHISRRVIEDAAEITLPARSGTLFVKKTKPKSYDYKFLRVDFKTTKDIGKTTMHLNEHSDGYNYMFRWAKKDFITRSKMLYELIMTRENKRALAKCIKNNTTDYIEI